MTQEFSKKGEYLKHILALMGAVADGHGFRKAGSAARFERIQSEEVTAAISWQTITTKLPRSVVALNMYASVRVRAVAELCATLFERDIDLPTIGAPLGRFTVRDEAISEYRFNWTRADEEQLERLKQDIAVFSKFCAGVDSYRGLDLIRLGRLPGLRRSFSPGLGETYKYTLPEVAAVIHQMNGHHDMALRALAIAELSTSGRLLEQHRTALQDYIEHHGPGGEIPIVE